MKYEDMKFKKPVESKDYKSFSDYAIKAINDIIKTAIKVGKNKIVINTNLRLGLPMENINKIAGPFVEAWAYETFFDALNSQDNKWKLVNVESQERLNRADILLQFKKSESVPPITSEIDVKATSEDLKDSGKSPNITSYARIRSAYVEDPDLIFIILSLKHKVYSRSNKITKLMDGIMEIVNHNAYDIKYLSKSDISYNPSLGTGQIQIRDIHYVETVDRSAWEFCKLLDKIYLNSSKRSFKDWNDLAKKHGWLKND